MIPYTMILLLNEKIRVGKTEIPVSLFIPIIFLIISAFAVNYLYAKKYNRVISYLSNYHPEVYEQKICRKPDVGPLYSTAYKYSKPLIELSKYAKSFNDHRLNQMLSEFVSFDRQLNRISSIIIFIGMFSFLVLAVVSMD